MTAPPPGPRLIFVNRYYWPEEPATAQLLTDLAEGLAAAGRRVTVIASRRGAALPARENRRGVDIVRVASTRSGRSLAARAFDYLTFGLAARQILAALVTPGDQLVVMTDPPVLATIGAARARRAGAQVIHWLQDVHPEISLVLSGSRLLAAASAPWRRRRDAAWRAAAGCVAISGDMAGLVARHGVPPERIHVIRNWAPGALAPVPAEQNPLREAWGLRDRVAVVYSGNLGRVHILEPVLGAAAALADDPSILFLFVGDGPQRAALQAAVRVRQLPNVRFLPSQPRARLAESLSAADIHLVTLRPGCERLVFPSKVYGIAAVGRPVVYVGPVDCELGATVRAGGFGLTLPSTDVGSLAAALRGLAADRARRQAMGAAALRWSQETGGFPAARDAWHTLLGSISNG